MVAACARRRRRNAPGNTRPAVALSGVIRGKYPLTNTSLKPPKQGNSTPRPPRPPSLAGRVGRLQRLQAGIFHCSVLRVGSALLSQRARPSRR